MNQIVEEAEKMPKKHKNLPDPNLSFTANIQLAGTQMAENLNADAIISVTEKGRSSQLLSSFRPKNKIIAITASLYFFLNGTHYSAFLFSSFYEIFFSIWLLVLIIRASL
jgi:pyruvate kinase